MPGAGAVVQGRQTLGMADENEGGGGFAPGGITHHLGVVGSTQLQAHQGRRRARANTTGTVWAHVGHMSVAEDLH